MIISDILKRGCGAPRVPDFGGSTMLEAPGSGESGRSPRHAGWPASVLLKTADGKPSESSNLSPSAPPRSALCGPKSRDTPQDR
jgi:hypothetical protein